MGSPWAALATRRARAAATHASFASASAGRLFGDAPFGGSMHPDRHVQYALAPLRERARELERNDSHIDGFLRSAVVNVIGPNGFDLQAKVTNQAGKLAEATNREIERGWKAFGEKGVCTPCGQFSLTQFCHLLYVMRKRDGEVFVRLLEGPEWAHGFALQPLPADMLDETFDRAPDASGSEIRQGIEFNGWGRPIAYHFSKRHPGDRWGGARSDRIRVPAADVIHLRRVRSAGQSRGYSELASILFDVFMYRGAVEAELVAWRQAASKGGVLEASSPEAISSYAAMLSTQQANALGEMELPESFSVAPGMNEYIAPGWTYKQIDPTHPNTNLESASRVFGKRIARGLKVSYGTYTGDTSDSNYSSMRAGLLPEREEFQAEQVDFITDFLVPVFRRWISAALLSGAVRLDSRLGSQYHEVAFKPRGWESVDPLKDRQAALLAILMGITSRTDEAAKHGKDWEDVIDTLCREMEYAASRSTPVPINGVAPGAPGQPADQVGEEDDDPGERRPTITRAVAMAALEAALRAA